MSSSFSNSRPFFWLLKIHPSVFVAATCHRGQTKTAYLEGGGASVKALRIVRGMVGRAVGMDCMDGGAPAGCEVVCIELTWVWLVWWNVIKTRTSFQKGWKVGHERFQTFHQNFPRQLLPPFPVFSSGDRHHLFRKLPRPSVQPPNFWRGSGWSSSYSSSLPTCFFCGLSMNPWLNQKGLPPSLPPLPWPSLWDRTSKLPFFWKPKKTIRKKPKLKNLDA